MAQDTEDKMKAAEELSGNPYGLSKTRIRALLVNLIGGESGRSVQSFTVAH